MTGTYDPLVVALSVPIAVSASYAALDLARRVTAAHGWVRETASFVRSAVAQDLSQSVSISSLETAVMINVTLFILGLAISLRKCPDNP